MSKAGIVVTGAAGFLGSHLCEHYLKLGHTVVGIDNFATGSRANIEYLNALGLPGFSFLEHDVCTPLDFGSKTFAVLNAVERIETIFHFASPASPPHYQRLSEETMWVNSVGLVNMMNLAEAKGGRVIFASTSEIYGDPDVHPQPESYWGNVNSFGVRSCYDEAKRFGESLIYSRNIRASTNHGLVRIFNTYGPRMNFEDGRVIINFLLQGLNGQPLTVYGDGSQTRSFCYVTDLIAAITTYAGEKISEPINIGNDREYSVLETAQVVQKLFGGSPKIEFFGLPQDDPKKRRPDLTKANSLLRWRPCVPLNDGLEKMLTWMKETRQT